MDKIMIVILSAALALNSEVETKISETKQREANIIESGRFIYDNSDVFVNFVNDNYSQLDSYERGRAVQDAVAWLSSNLNLANIPSIVYYSGNDGVCAYYNPFDDTIYINNLEVLSGEFFMEALAHEMRHKFQIEHIYDESEYGQALRDNNLNYISGLDGNLDSYFSQFIEKDAVDYSVNICSVFENYR